MLYSNLRLRSLDDLVLLTFSSLQSTRHEYEPNGPRPCWVLYVAGDARRVDMTSVKQEAQLSLGWADNTA